VSELLNVSVHGLLELPAGLNRDPLRRVVRLA
jgi:hypothetical protein